MMEKKNEPSPKKAKSTTTGAHVTDADSPDNSSHDGSTDLNEDELAAFNAIMGDIDRQEEKQLDGTPQNAGTENIDRQETSEEVPAALDDAIDTINSENPTELESPDSTDSEAMASGQIDEESLDEDQQRAFERIMAQIESGELADTGAVKEADEAVESEADGDFAAQLEEVVKTADADDDQGSADAQGDEPADDDGLDPDQQQALESIMAQINGGGEADDAIGSEKETEEAVEPEADEDFTAQLEAVAKAADADDDKGAAGAQGDEPADDDGLDPDQQQALESIMAQIQGGGEADDTIDSEKDASDEPEPEDADDFSAELERVVQESVDAEDSERAETDDALNADQQRAFESIMAQIEGGDGDPAEPVSAKAESAQAHSDKSPEDQEQQPAEPTKEKNDDGSPNSPYDIEEILTEIAASDDTSPPPEAGSNEAGSQKSDVDDSEKSRDDEDAASDGKAGSEPERAESRHAATTARPIGTTGKPDESLRVKGTSTDPRPAKKEVPARSVDPQKPEPLREASKKAAGRQKKVLLASAVALLFLALAGYYYKIPQNLLSSMPVAPDTGNRIPETAVDVQPAVQMQKTQAVVDDPSDQSRLKAAAENLDRLRNQLIDKQAEIGELRAYYQAGIDAEIQAIADKAGTMGKGTISFKSAAADPSISLGLAAIQRRETYIRKLETPVSILADSGEELLFYSRKAALLALMVGKTSDIDIDGFIQQTDEIRNRHGGELDRLNIDAVPASPRTLESIWLDVEKQMPATAQRTDNDGPGNDTDNAAIWRSICEGDFSRKHMLTALSPDAARCLTTWKGKDLFLNALTDLSPEAARHLSEWQGEWLGLNGLRDLSPEAAVHLSRWKGKGLSLNSLSRLSPRVVAILSDWQGDQIELINVKHMAHWENPKTRLFLSEDLKRKLSATGK